MFIGGTGTGRQHPVDLPVALGLVQPAAAGEVPAAAGGLVGDMDIFHIPAGAEAGVVVTDAQPFQLPQIRGDQDPEGIVAALFEMGDSAVQFVFLALFPGAVEGDVYIGIGAGPHQEIAGADADAVGVFAGGEGLGIQRQHIFLILLLPVEPATAGEIPDLVPLHDADILQIPFGFQAGIIVGNGDLLQCSEILLGVDAEQGGAALGEGILAAAQLVKGADAVGAVEFDEHLCVGPGVGDIAGADLDHIVRGVGPCHALEQEMIERLSLFGVPEPGVGILPLDLGGIVEEIYPALTVQAVHIIDDPGIQMEGHTGFFIRVVEIQDTLPDAVHQPVPDLQAAFLRISDGAAKDDPPALPQGAVVIAAAAEGVDLFVLLGIVFQGFDQMIPCLPAALLGLIIDGLRQNVSVRILEGNIIVRVCLAQEN